jgi:hypothetical protein
MFSLFSTTLAAFSRWLNEPINPPVPEPKRDEDHFLVLALPRLWGGAPNEQLAIDLVSERLGRIDPRVEIVFRFVDGDRWCWGYSPYVLDETKVAIDTALMAMSRGPLRLRARLPQPLPADGPRAGQAASGGGRFPGKDRPEPFQGE